ncbi:hypothetical protein CI610_02708 [invertebrate metagenome]|uniref:Uncharacterized protein n=1 Tax=invertebrate metagenome TaxID=1711999 RepID=A0A2H9T556_9ZZZZ
MIKRTVLKPAKYIFFSFVCIPLAIAMGGTQPIEESQPDHQDLWDNPSLILTCIFCFAEAPNIKKISNTHYRCSQCQAGIHLADSVLEPLTHPVSISVKYLEPRTTPALPDFPTKHPKENQPPSLILCTTSYLEEKEQLSIMQGLFQENHDDSLFSSIGIFRLFHEAETNTLRLQEETIHELKHKAHILCVVLESTTQTALTRCMILSDEASHNYHLIFSDGVIKHISVNELTDKLTQYLSQRFSYHMDFKSLLYTASFPIDFSLFQ